MATTLLATDEPTVTKRDVADEHPSSNREVETPIVHAEFTRGARPGKVVRPRSEA
jgi:hypothetical protein